MPIDLSTLKSANSDQLLSLIKRRHPEYSEKQEHWEFLELSYKGGREWIDKNIFSYHKEGKKEFAERKKRAYRFPHSREVISLVNKYVFKGNIERKKSPPKHIQEFWKSATLLKRPIEDLMNDISARTSTFGRVWVVVDNNMPAGAVTEADRKRVKGRCYAYIINPQDALDFEYDDDGELDWFLCAEYVREPGSPMSSSGEITKRYRLWTKDYTVSISLTKQGGTEIAKLGDVRATGLGIVPIFPADNISSENLYTSCGLIEDVAYLDRAVANYLSNLDVIILDQTFSQLAIPYQGMLTTEDIGDEEDEDFEARTNIQIMGTKRVFAYNAEGGAAPTFISPDVKQADIIMKAVTKIVGEIYHSIGMAGERTKEDNAAGIDNSSGVAKAYDFEKLNAMLAAKARSLQNIEKNLIRMVLAWHSDVRELEDVPEVVTYPSTFDVRNLADEMDNAQRLSVMGAPTSVRRMQMKRLVEKMFPQIENKDAKKIIEDIDEEWLEEPEMEAAALPTMNRPDVKNLSGSKPVPGKKNRQGENNKGSDDD